MGGGRYRRLGTWDSSSAIKKGWNSGLGNKHLKSIRKCSAAQHSRAKQPYMMQNLPVVMYVCMSDD